MIVSRRFFTWSDVVIRRWLVRHPSFLVKIVQTKGVCSEDCLWEKARLWSVVPDWPCVGIPLRGHGLMRNAASAIDMRRGYIGFMERGGEFRARTEPTEAFGVFVQWDPAVFGKPKGPRLTRAPIDARDLARVGAALMGIVRGQSDSAPEAHVADLFEVLGALGILAERPALGDLVVPASARARVARVGNAIDGVLSRTGTRPMVVDLMRALDCSERQARYLVGEYVGEYALQGATEWRTLVTVWTTYLAGLLMTARGATTEGVASLLGYSSPNALCHSLTNAGLPSPGEMRRIVATMT